MARHHEHAPQTLVGIEFDDIFRAQEFLTAATGLAAHKKLVLEDAVFVIKQADGKTVVHETRDMQPGRSALSGGVWASLFGLILGGPVGWLAGAAIGASAGAVTAKLVDIGVSDEWVEWFRAAVQPDKAILVLLVSEVNEAALLEEARRFTGAELIYANLDRAKIEELKDALGDTTPVDVDTTQPKPEPEPSTEGHPAESRASGSAGALRDRFRLGFAPEVVGAIVVTRAGRQVERHAQRRGERDRGRDVADEVQATHEAVVRRADDLRRVSMRGRRLGRDPDGLAHVVLHLREQRCGQARLHLVRKR